MLNPRDDLLDLDRVPHDKGSTFPMLTNDTAIDYFS